MASESPVELLLETVQWKETDCAKILDSPLPYATHEGVLHIGDATLRCYRLNTGQAIFNAEDLNRFFDELSSLDSEVPK